MRIEPATEAKQRRLTALLGERGRDAHDPRLAEVVADAQLLGSLDLAGVPASWDAVRASRTSLSPPREIAALRAARLAVPKDAPFTVTSLRAWHAAIAGPIGFRRTPCERGDAPPAPPDEIESRLATLEEWLGAPGIRDLRPEQTAGLAYARILEILPFDSANGRVARLAASHLMVDGGMHPPILVGADGPYLRACLRAAFRLDTEPLVSLLVEASSRALEVMIQSLERGEV